VENPQTKAGQENFGFGKKIFLLKSCSNAVENFAVNFTHTVEKEKCGKSC